MKFSSFLKFSVFVFVLLLVASCAEQEVIEESTSLDETITVEEQLKLDQQKYEAYAAEHGEVTIERMTLEEYQAFAAEHNLPPVSEEIIKKYHKRSLEKATGACNSGWINFCGDLNRNGTFSASDLAHFILNCNSLCNIQACGYSTTCPTDGLSSIDPVRTFGYLTFYFGGSEILFFNKYDFDAGVEFVLGLAPC